MKFYTELNHEIVTRGFERLDFDKELLLNYKNKKEAKDYLQQLIKEDQEFLNNIIIEKE